MRIGFAFAFAFAGAAGDVGVRSGVGAAQGEHAHVQGAVEAPVAAAVEPVADDFARALAGIGATPARRAKAASLRSRPGCDQATSSQAAQIGPTLCRASSCGASACTRRVSSASSGSASPRSCWIRRASERRAWQCAARSQSLPPRRRAQAATSARCERPCRRALARRASEEQGSQLVASGRAGADGALAGDEQRA